MRKSVLMLVVALAGAAAQPLDGLQLPQMLGEGTLSTGQIEYGPAFTPDGDTIYFTRRASFDDPPRIWSSSRAGEKWTTPRLAPFNSDLGDEHPSFAPDGQRLFFSSARPVNGFEQSGRNDLWVVQRTSDGWSDPEHLGGAFSSPDIESHPVVTDRGIFFHARRPGGEGGVDAWFARGPAGFWALPELLPFNSSATDGEVAPSPDGRSVIFYSDRPGGHGRGDLYKASRHGDGWSEPRNLGPEINTPAWEWTPTFTPDGRYLVFARLNAESTDSDLMIVAVPEGG